MARGQRGISKQGSD